MSPFPVDSSDPPQLSRRDVLKALGVAALAFPDIGMGQARGAPVVAAQLVPPFPPTGWKAVWLDHLSYQCTDYEKAAAFYVALMGWKVRSDDGKQAVLEMGDAAGDIIIKGGLTAAPPAALTDASPGSTRAQALFDGFAWGISPWNAERVRADLEQRGLAPVAENDGDYQSFRVRDPDGFALSITNGSRALRRRSPATGRLRVAAPFKPTEWRTAFVDHLSFEVADYRRSVAFYQALFGWEVRSAPGPGPAWPDSPNSMTVRIGDIAGAIVRNSAGGGRGGRGRGSDSVASAAAREMAARPVTATMGHISFGIDSWNRDRVRAELIERDVAYLINGQRIPRDDMAGGLESYHVPDAMGWDLQISNRTTP